VGQFRILLSGASPAIAGLRWESDRPLRIGRQSNQDIVLPDPSVSRRHAEVVSEGPVWLVRDLGSLAGTFFNGVRVGPAGQVLRPRDVITCGNMSLTVSLVTIEEPPDTRPIGSGLIQTPVQNIRTSGSYVRVEARAQNSWEQAMERVAQAADAGQRQSKHLQTLVRACHHLCQVGSLDELLQSILDDMVHVLEAQRGAILLADEATGHLNLRAFAMTGRRQDGKRWFSKTLAQRSFQEGESLLCRDVQTDLALVNAGSVSRGTMASILCLLLRSPRRRLGVLHLDRGPLQEPFTEEDFLLADAIAASVSAGIESAQLVEKQRDLFLRTVTAMARAVDLRDQYTGSHTHRVTMYSLLLAEELRLPETDRYVLQVGTPLHDIGKIAVDDAILRKPGKLTAREFEQMKLHVLKGAAILEPIPDLAPMVPIIRHHHERWDGSGYPDGLAAVQISKLARIVAVADAFDAMTSDRPYRQALPISAAVAEIAGKAGTHFDPEVVHAFLQLRPRIQDILNRQGSLESLLGTLPPPPSQAPTLVGLSQLLASKTISAASGSLDAESLKAVAVPR
jgi:HD-GYP domain-containing protein (c-di-GMP phosphodiesterase class II)